MVLADFAAAQAAGTGVAVGPVVRGAVDPVVRDATGTRFPSCVTATRLRRFRLRQAAEVWG